MDIDSDTIKEHFLILKRDYNNVKLLLIKLVEYIEQFPQIQENDQVLVTEIKNCVEIILWFDVFVNNTEIYFKNETNNKDEIGYILSQIHFFFQKLNTILLLNIPQKISSKI